ncbi:alpha/beta hydrolase [Leucobacter aridicollis]|uniref:alpha/beta hydrolase n=1 Tax=Leucobacter aridicollis TaxID=283878 RepID=UPI0021676343|nr:alpha/beta hydrolase [Leucobacter aridicollis]MCS3429236.1 acetyl esterase/lipase [Leucobacter aridicollis]
MRRSLLRAAPLALAAMLALSACVPSEAEGDELVGHVSVTSFEVAGPVPAPTGGINRAGSVRVPVRGYEPVGDVQPWATLVWAHGGSFIRGTLDWPEADWVSRSFAAAGLRVISVDYVLASDTVKAPAPSNDVAAVVAWAGAEYGGPLVVGGASAGAHLATLATLAQAERAPGRAAAALLLEYPTMHRTQRVDPQLADAVAALPEARRFRADRIAEMYSFYLGNGLTDGGALVVGELPADRLALLPPTIIVNADADELRASGEEFADQLRAAGVPVTERIETGTVHGYLNRPDESASAREQSAATMAHFVSELRRTLSL